jgi:hypothetical protein
MLNTFTPSLLYALDDGILPVNFLKVCVYSYLKDSNIDASTDP